MDTLLIVLLGVISVVVVVGALMANKKENPLHLERSRRDDMADARPVFLYHDKQWTPVSPDDADTPETKTEEVAPDEATSPH